MQRFRMLALVVVLALAGTACGGSDDTASDNPTTTVGGAGASDDTGSGDTTGDVPTGLADEDCQFLLAGTYLNPLVAAQSGEGTDLQYTSAQLEAIADEAPDEIKDAMAIVSDRYAQLADTLKDVDLTDPQSYSSPEVQAALDRLDTVFDDDYQAAVDTVSQYVSDNCAG